VQSPRTASDAANTIRKHFDSTRFAREYANLPSNAIDVIGSDMAILRIKSWSKIRDVNHRPNKYRSMFFCHTTTTRALINLDSFGGFRLARCSFLNSERDIKDKSGYLTR